jgi:hypothetical protein
MKLMDSTGTKGHLQLTDFELFYNKLLKKADSFN